jgi:hypothetical protein
MQTRHLLTASLLTLAAGTFGPAAAGAAAQALTAGGDISAQGAFSCDLTLPGSVLGDPSLEPVGATLERDRMLMARRPGLLRKHIPLRIDPATGNLQSGGRYLFLAALQRSRTPRVESHGSRRRLEA